MQIIDNLVPKVLLGAALILSVLAAYAADINSGNRIYQMHCASCHGPKGISIIPGAPNLARGEGLMQPDTMLLTTLRTGRGAMPGYLGILTDREILDVVAYSRTLR